MNNTPTFHLEDNVSYYEHASYTWSEDSIRYVNTVTPHIRNCYLYMQECGIFMTTSPYFTERSNLPSYLILYTLSGEGKLRYNHHTWKLLPGRCFFINCIKAHRYEALPGKNWDFLWLHFYGNQSSFYYEDFSLSSPPVLMLHDTFLVESALRRILSIHQKKAVYAEILTANLITNIITELMIQKITESENGSKHPNLVNDAIVYIQSHYTDVITLDNLARQICVSKYHLSREFTRHMGISINQYLIAYRIACAKRLLLESKLSVEDVAFQVGMNHVSHFIHLFKAREGITPLEYRKLWE